MRIGNVVEIKIRKPIVTNALPILVVLALIGIAVERDNHYTTKAKSLKSQATNLNILTTDEFVHFNDSVKNLLPENQVEAWKTKLAELKAPQILGKLMDTTKTAITKAK